MTVQGDYFQQLRDEVEREVMACIGCNDCMLACPLPEKQWVTIAELNAGVLAERITSQNVADFVDACTQCQQCIPVCPADLHRADMVLWNKMKVEDAAPNQEMPLQVGQQVTASGWTLDALAEHLTSLSLFNGVEPRHLRRILLSATLRQLAEGEVLCREGEFHERLYVVLDGEIEQSISQGETQARILLLGAGSFYGEMAVLGNQEEIYTLTAETTALVLEFSKASVHRLIRESGTFSRTMDELYRRRALWTYARQSSLFSALSEDVADDLLQQSYLRMLSPGEVVFYEGDPAGDLYLVRAGFLRVARQHGSGELVLQYYREGDLFGVSALLFGESQSATISANTRSEVIVIPGNVILQLLMQEPLLRQHLREDAQRANQMLQGSTSRPRAAKPEATIAGLTTMHTLSLEGLIDQGVIQGYEVLVIDTSICTNCNNCVESCERRHGYSRLERRGLQMENLLFPTACRHCEDPVCLLCSVNGIVRQPDGEISIVTDNCIGCGACSERCPYGNIQMHDREKKPRNPVFDLLSFAGLRPDSKQDEASQAERVAVKCDLCQGYNDYACVRGCPVGAAMRVNPVEQFQRDDLHIGLELKEGDREQL